MIKKSFPLLFFRLTSPPSTPPLISTMSIRIIDTTVVNQTGGYAAHVTYCIALAAGGRGMPLIAAEARFATVEGARREEHVGARVPRGGHGRLHRKACPTE